MSPALSIVDVYTILKDTQRWKEHDKLSQLDLIVGCGYYSTTSPDVIWPKASQISLLRICWCRMYEEKLYALGFKRFEAHMCLVYVCNVFDDSEKYTMNCYIKPVTVTVHYTEGSPF